MKKHLASLAVLATVILLALGFTLPNIVAAMQDWYSNSQANRREVTGVELNTAVSQSKENLSEALQFAAQDYQIVELPESQEKEKAEAAYQIAKEALYFFSRQDAAEINADEYDQHEEYSFLAVSEEKSKILWQCFLQNRTEGKYVTMVVDPEVNKMVKFSIQNEVLGQTYAGEQYWADLLAEYYGFWEAKTEWQLSYGETETFSFWFIDTNEVMTEVIYRYSDISGQEFNMTTSSVVTMYPAADG